MARATVLPAAGYVEMPWRNGAGVTREIAIDDAPGAAAPFRWRLSMADLAGDGPFSELPDVDRVLLLLAGDQVALAIDGSGQPLPGQPAPRRFGSLAAVPALRAPRGAPLVVLAPISTGLAA